MACCAWMSQRTVPNKCPLDFAEEHVSDDAWCDLAGAGDGGALNAGRRMCW